MLRADAAALLLRQLLPLSMLSLLLHDAMILFYAMLLIRHYFATLLMPCC